MIHNPIWGFTCRCGNKGMGYGIKNTRFTWRGALASERLRGREPSSDDWRIIQSFGWAQYTTCPRCGEDVVCNPFQKLLESDPIFDKAKLIIDFNYDNKSGILDVSFNDGSHKKIKGKFMTGKLTEDYCYSIEELRKLIPSQKWHDYVKPPKAFPFK